MVKKAHERNDPGDEGDHLTPHARTDPEPLTLREKLLLIAYLEGKSVREIARERGENAKIIDLEWKVIKVKLRAGVRARCRP